VLDCSLRAAPQDRQSELLPSPVASPLRPPLKWAGGKRWLVPRLRELYVPYKGRRLVEPFCGGLAVSLGLRPNEALLSDVNRHLTNFYRWVSKGVAFSVKMENNAEVFYQNRERFNQLLQLGKEDTAEAAGLFFYLNRTGFNGLCRFNRSGLFNVPFGRYARLDYTGLMKSFRTLGHAMRNWELQCCEFRSLEFSKEDFLYADPPYDVEFTQYSKGGFSWSDQLELAEILAGHPGPVVASNQATKRVLDLYRSLGFNVEVLPAPRRISCNGDRAPATEMLATRNIES